jgi:adenine-specific DNA-methyltransferase
MVASPFDIGFWQTNLGLLPVPLLQDNQTEPSYVLLNGSKGNFCLDLSGNPVSPDTRNSAWSANVGHYLSLGRTSIEVQRWDKGQAEIERYRTESILKDLEKFHSYLEQAAPTSAVSVVSHAIQVYRSLRATIRQEWQGSQSLKSFLYLLACATDNTDRKNLNLGKWRLSEQAAEVVYDIHEADWQALQVDLERGRPIQGLKPQLNLVLRHASGQLFQEAHYEALTTPSNQLRLSGFLPAPVEVAGAIKKLGLHFTPPSLARTIVEEALARVDLNAKDSLVIFDPACGSGEFLREAVRQLKMRKYVGNVTIVGWDISPAACDMANFVLAWETQDFPSVIQIHNHDSLDPEKAWPNNVDVLLMNPPFVSVEDMTADQKQRVNEILDKLSGNRLNLAHAFIWMAAKSINDNGVLGAILPASVLDGNSAQKLRDALSSHLVPRLIGRLGSYLLFTDAMIDAAMYVAQKKTNLQASKLPLDPPVALWTNQYTSSNSAGLRGLRKIRSLGNSPTLYPEVGDGYSIYIDPGLLHSNNWSPRPYEARMLLEQVRELPQVKDLFIVHQGVRTGRKATFLLNKYVWEELPEKERPYFRPAVINDSIHFGYLQDSAYIFYPYGERYMESEKELRIKVPTYYENYLIPVKEKLAQRNLENWWLLTRHRTWQVERTPKLVSTYYGDAGSFAWDDTGDYVVVQGYVWLPKKSFGTRGLPRLMGMAYLAIVNSPLFSTLLSGYSKQVSGGQWYLSKQFVDNIPIPDLFDPEVRHDLVDELAQFGERIYKGYGIQEAEKLKSLLASIYQIS